MSIPASVEDTFLGIFHVHAMLCNPEGEWDCRHDEKPQIHFTLVPQEGNDWVRAQFFSMEDDGTSIAAQVELKLMEWGFEATWVWTNCMDPGCFIGQFGREGTRKRVSDSGAYGDRFKRAQAQTRVEKPSFSFPTR